MHTAHRAALIASLVPASLFLILARLPNLLSICVWKTGHPLLSALRLQTVTVLQMWGANVSLDVLDAVRGENCLCWSCSSQVSLCTSQLLWKLQAQHRGLLVRSGE